MHIMYVACGSTMGHWSENQEENQEVTPHTAAGGHELCVLSQMNFGETDVTLSDFCH